MHYGSVAKRSVLAATAGMDLLLCSEQHTSQGIKALDALLGGYRDGRMNQSDFQAAAAQVIALQANMAG